MLLVSHEPEASTVSQPVSGDVLVEFLKDLEIFKSLYSICLPGSAQEQLSIDLQYLLVLARYSVKPNEETPSLLLKLNDFISVIKDQIGKQPQPPASAAGSAAMDEDAPVRRQRRPVQRSERRDRALVDMRDEPRRRVEVQVRSPVLLGEGVHGQAEFVRIAHAASSIASNQRR